MKQFAYDLAMMYAGGAVVFAVIPVWEGAVALGLLALILMAAHFALGRKS